MTEKTGEIRHGEKAALPFAERACAREFYAFTADCLPDTPFARVLDLGCGAGTELEEYYRRNAFACVTGIGPAPEIPAAKKEGFPDKELTLLEKSFFSAPLGVTCYDAAVSVGTLYSCTAAEKLPLYQKIVASLKVGGYFILTDCFADTGAADGAPLSVECETETLLAAGFSEVEILNVWGDVYTLCAQK